MDAQAYLAQILTELKATVSQVPNQTCEQIVGSLIEADRIFLAGAGRSGLAVKGFAMRLMHMGLSVHVVGEITTPSLSQNDILVVGSGSGSTASLVAMARKAQTIGAKIVLITIVADSPIGQVANIVLQIPAPSAKIDPAHGLQSVQPMGTLFEQAMSLTFDTLILLLMARLSITSETMFTRHANLE